MVGNACEDGQHGREADRGTVAWVCLGIPPEYTRAPTPYDILAEQIPAPIFITVFPDDYPIQALLLHVGEYAPRMQHTTLNPNPTP